MASNAQRNYVFLSIQAQDFIEETGKSRKRVKTP